MSVRLIIGIPNPFGLWNVGIFTADFFRWAMKAEESGTIETGEHYFYKVSLQGLMKYIGPLNSFYFKSLHSCSHDLAIFLGDNRVRNVSLQDIAGAILDVAQRIGCEKIYLLDAVVSITHHLLFPRVVSVTNGGEDAEKMLRDIGAVPIFYEKGEKFISGFNKLLIQQISQRGMQYVELITEIPFYAPEMSLYPKASAALIEVLRRDLGVYPDLTLLHGYIEAADVVLDSAYEELSGPLKEALEKLRRETIKEMEKECHHSLSQWESDALEAEVEKILKRGGNNDFNIPSVE